MEKELEKIIEQVESEEEEKVRKVRKVLIPAPHEWLTWNEKQKRWIDQDVTNWFINYIHRNKGKWTYEHWSGRTDDAWRNGWLDFEKLLNILTLYPTQNILAELSYQANMTKNQTNYEVMKESEESSDTVSSFEDEEEL
jgi:hypothetical protein